MTGHLAGGEERGHAVAPVFVAAVPRLTGAHGQHRFAAVQCQEVALLVDSEHDRVLRWRDIETDNPLVRATQSEL